MAMRNANRMGCVKKTGQSWMRIDIANKAIKCPENFLLMVRARLLANDISA